MFESLSDRLDTAFKNLKGQGRITELNIASTIKDIRRALVDADVNYKIAKDLTDRIKDKAMGEKVLTAVSPGQLMVKIVKDELAELMGGHEEELNLTGKPTIILIAGLQGSGKTTFSGKLANFLKTKKSRATTNIILALRLIVVTPHQFEKSKRIAHGMDLADLVGVNDADRKAEFFFMGVVVWMKFECETPSHPKTPEARQPFSLFGWAPI